MADKYRRAEKQKPSAEASVENELRITTQGRTRNAITYATTLLTVRAKHLLALSARLSSHCLSSTGEEIH